MRKIIIIKNKKTNRLTVKIAIIKDIDIVNGYLFITTNNRYFAVYLANNDYIIQTFRKNNLKIFNENYILKHSIYF